MKWIKTEKDLLSPILSIAPFIVREDCSYAVTTELPAGYRIIDIMIATLPETWDRKNLSHFVSKLRPLTLQSLVVLERIFTFGRISKRKLARELHIDQTILEEKYLSFFENLGLISRVTAFSYEITEWVKWSPSEVISIEAKLYRWKEALEQAMFNMRFADRTYVAFPEEIFQRYKNEMKVAKHVGVGVIIVRKNGDAEVEIDAKNNHQKKFIDRGLQKLRILRDLILLDNRWKINEF